MRTIAFPFLFFVFLLNSCGKAEERNEFAANLAPLLDPVKSQGLSLKFQSGKGRLIDQITPSPQRSMTFSKKTHPWLLLWTQKPPIIMPIPSRGSMIF